MPDIAVNEERCTRCGACVAVCAEARVFEMGERTAEVVRPDDCWLCGHCVAVCPVDAVEHEAYPLEACPVIDAPPSYDALVTALRERRSLRVFRDEPVPRETVRQLVDVSRWAPSASNAQAVDWIALDDPERIARLSEEVVATLGRVARLLQIRLLRPLLSLALGRRNVEEAVESADEFDRLAEAAARGEDPIFHHAPVVLIAHVPQVSYFGRDDAVYAAYNVMLAAERLGLGTCHIGYVNVALERSSKVAGIVGLPPERQIEVAMTLGYPRFAFRRALPRRRMELAWNPVGTIEFQALVEGALDAPELRDEIEALMASKRRGEELERGPRIASISEFIERELARLEEGRFEHAYETRTASVVPYNRVFRAVLDDIWS